MAPRANWKGYLKLSLVSCPVALYPASSTSSRVSFNTLNKATGNKVKRIYVDPVTGDEVGPEEQAKGYAVAKGSYLIVDEAELDAVQIESSHTIDIQKFVPRTEIDPRYIDTPYYVAPDDRVGEEAFSVIREAMRQSKKVALGRVVIARRERVVMIEPWKKGLLATVLRYDYEVRDDAAYFADIRDVKIQADLLDLAHMIVEKKSGRFDPAEFEDRYENAVVEMLKRKQAGQPALVTPAARPANVIDLVEALKRSVAAEAAKPGRKASRVEAQPKPAAPSKSRRKDAGAAAEPGPVPAETPKRKRRAGP